MSNNQQMIQILESAITDYNENMGWCKEHYIRTTNRRWHWQSGRRFKKNVHPGSIYRHSLLIIDNVEDASKQNIPLK